MQQPNPDLIDELYQNMQKKFPGELYFPMYFDIPLDKESFKQGKRWGQDDENRTAIAIHNNIPKKFNIRSFKDQSRIQASVFTQVNYSNDQKTKRYSSNIQFGTANEELDLEYMFHFHVLNEETQEKIFDFERRESWHHRSFGTRPLRFRIQYTPRYTNSAGSYYQLYGYVYLPKRKK